MNILKSFDDEDDDNNNKLWAQQPTESQGLPTDCWPHNSSVTVVQ